MGSLTQAIIPALQALFQMSHLSPQQEGSLAGQEDELGLQVLPAWPSIQACGHHSQTAEETGGSWGAGLATV